MSQPEAALLFAAGLGTRMRPLTDDRPKPLVEVAGKTLIDHALELVTPLALPRVVANAHYRGDMLAAHLNGSGVALSQEAPVVLETGGGLKQALPLLGPGPVFTLNTDAVWRGPNPLLALRDTWNADRMDALLLCVPRAQVHGHKGKGDFLIGPDGRLSRGPGAVYSGLQIIKTEALAGIDKQVFSMWELWQPMLEAGRMHGLAYDGEWCDVGYPQAVEIAEEMLANV
ncbi:nucleotidyltransferase family protein [Marinovum sp.]|uniref:nucleotidyltransferase family protein n=1 Tax=Marinovum sp. TaxID=2024839 RepID=UPI003A94408C